MQNESQTPADAEGVGQPKREASLAAPNGSESWVVITDHPYYPEADYFPTEDEARRYAETQIAKHHTEAGIHEESLVCIARVVALAQIKTDY